MDLPRTSCFLLAAAVLAGILAVVIAAPQAHTQAVADPDYWRATEERRKTVYRHFYRQSPQAIPGSYDPVAEAERITFDAAQREANPANPKARSLWQRMRTMTIKTGLGPRTRVLGGFMFGSTASAGVRRLENRKRHQRQVAWLPKDQGMARLECR